MGHSTASGRTAAERRENAAVLQQTFREATASRERTLARNRELADLEREIERNGFAYYKGYGIDRSTYGDTVNVQYAGDDIFFDSVDEARGFIDQVTSEETGNRRRRNRRTEEIPF